MINIVNNDTKKYCIYNDNKKAVLMPGDRAELENGSFSVFRVYAKNSILNKLIKAALFLLCIFFVFLDTDYENGEYMLVSVRFNCTPISQDLKLELSPSPIININKSGQLKADFCVERYLLIAHILSVILYSLIVIGLFVFLAVFSKEEKLLCILFFALSAAALAFAVYIIYYTIKRYRKTVNYLNDYFNNYIY